MDPSPRERFRAACREGRLTFQWDPGAGRAIFYPRVGEGLEWRESAGLGTIYSTTWVHRRGEPPLNVALVDLDEGFRMMSRVEAAEVRIGMRVRVRFLDDGLPVFDPA